MNPQIESSLMRLSYDTASKQILAELKKQLKNKRKQHDRQELKYNPAN